MAFPLDLSGRFHAPEFVVLEKDGACVAVDRERANWICLNRAGIELLGVLPGKSFDEARRGFAAASGLSADDCDAALRRFLSDLARKEFLSTEPLPDDPAPRAAAIRPEKLHEVFVVTNYECNMACRHCYAHERVTSDRRRVRTGALLGMMDECRALGAEIFYLTGGEPFLHGDLAALVAGATARSRAVVFTNGTLATPQAAAALAPFRDRLVVQVSLEGPDEETNGVLRGKGSFARAMEGIRNLLSAGIRVGVSSTPTPLTAAGIPALTRRLAGISVSGRGIDYHHIIYILDAGNARGCEALRLPPDALVAVLAGCRDAVRQARAEGVRTRLEITNDRIFEAVASHGPRKDLCGAGYTILGINADGTLHPCATTMHDERYNLGRLLDGGGDYIPGEIGRLWREDAAVRRIRALTARPPRGGAVRDLRYFHGGGCWYHMRDPGGDIAVEHPFYAAYEALTAQAILETATRRIPERDPTLRSVRPRIYASMARTRIACAGVRKTTDLSRCGRDIGYCICFA